MVVGGGFGGLAAALKLARQPVRVTLIDRRNFHLFQPLLYQVATGALSPSEICFPLRTLFRNHPNVRVLLAEVIGFDLARRRVLTGSVGEGLPAPQSVAYDTLVVAGGAQYNYFGHDEWRNASPELKSLENALDVRRRILSAFEAAENERDRARRAAWLTFVIVGAGPTGVEMAGQIAEIAHDTRRDFRAATTDMPRILLVEAADRVLGAFPRHLSAKATAALAGLGVDVLTGHTVTDITNDTVAITNPEGVTTGIPTRTTIWAAGVTASGLAAELAHASGAQTDRAGRITVEPNLSLANHPDVFAIGDMITIRHGSGTTALPGLAPVAMQQGRYVVRVLRNRRRGRPSRPFRYCPKGDLATIGRRRAVATLRGVRLSGTIAWVIWLAVHLFYLLGLQNRLIVLVRWSFSFVTHGRSSRLITHVDAVTPAPLPTHRLRAPHERPSSFE